MTILYQEMLNGLRVWCHKKRLFAKRKNAENFVERAVNTGKPVKVELAGHVKRKEMADWIVTDIEGKADIAFDLLERFPFPDDSVDHVYSSHVLEHFSYPTQMQHVLQESRRILRTGGIFSIAVPDVRFYLDFYFDQEREVVSQN